MRTVLLLIIFSLLLAACSSKEPLPLQTEEFFTSRVNDEGETQFAFGLAWQQSQAMTPAPDSSHEKQASGIERRPFTDRGPHHNQLDKQGKLQLEEQAAEKLQAQIDKREMCEKGHKVEQVIWEVRRIRLMGHCL